MRPCVRLRPIRFPGPSPGHQAGAPLRHPVGLSHQEGRDRPSPGHQAGAPLRPRDGRQPHRVWHLPPAIRPGLHCGLLFWVSLLLGIVSFPRPSGRGSIAASSSPDSPESGPELPPAIRPGLHCGPERHAVRTRSDSPLPPAIRPGLHCGVTVPTLARSLRTIFPRPSGRGSIAAPTSRRPRSRRCRTSPGHQAGAPLRRLSPDLSVVRGV